MAKRSKPQEEPGEPQVTPQQGSTLLNQQLARGEYLLSKRPISSDDYSTWELVTKNVLEKAFGRGSPNVTSITSVGKYGFGFSGRTAAEYEADRANDLTTQLTKMRGLIELLGTEAELQTGGAAHTHPKVNGHRIFLVHGHDDHALQLVSRFMEKLGQEVVVLREQPNKGRTIIEKFEDYSDVGFAVVLLTADDRGGSKDIEFANQKLRARQNVIFELGYFIGRLGRNRVCALYRSGVEIPSDYSGVLYQELDEKGAWRLELARELKAAGLPIDMNNAL